MKMISSTTSICMTILYTYVKGLSVLNRGSYISAHVLLNLLNELRKRVKCEACRAFYLFSATSLINSIIQGHEC